MSDEGQPATQEIAEAIAHRCPSCAAPVQLDGTQRNPTCAGCGTTFLLPDAVWARLHPPRDARPFVLVLDGSARAEGFTWFGLTDAVPLPGGDVVVAAMDGDGALVARLDGRLRPKWRKLAIKAEELRIAVTPDGRVLLLDPQRHALSVLSVEDGSSLGNLGGREPDGATVHHLDVFEAADIAACTDGTLFVSVADRFARYDAQGNGIATWPPARGWLSWLWGTEKPQPLYGPDRSKRGTNGAGTPGEDRPHAPNLMLHSRFLALPDGGLLISSVLPPLHAYRRDGTLAWSWEIPSGATVPMFNRPALGPDGSIWTAAAREDGGSEVWRRAPDGTSHSMGTSPHHLACVAPFAVDGAWLFGAGGEVWRLSGREIRAANAGAVERAQYDAEYGDNEADPDEAW